MCFPVKVRVWMGTFLHCMSYGVRQCDPTPRNPENRDLKQGKGNKQTSIMSRSLVLCLDKEKVLPEKKSQFSFHPLLCV